MRAEAGCKALLVVGTVTFSGTPHSTQHLVVPDAMMPKICKGMNPNQRCVAAGLQGADMLAVSTYPLSLGPQRTS